MQLNIDNWFYCPTCDRISYDYKCECHATYCNAGGCEKCAPLHELVKNAIKNHLCPDLLELKEKQKDDAKYWAEDKLLNEIFGDTDKQLKVTEDYKEKTKGANFGEYSNE